jgi:predicted nucleic acid-binding protein
MAIVPDVSAVLALALSDEDADFANAVIDAIATESADVPSLFWFEIRNALLMAERRKRLSIAQTSSFLSHLDVLPLHVDTRPREPVVLDLVRRCGLTVYDAAYLELSLRKQLPLATLDGALRAAAVSEGATLF